MEYFITDNNRRIQMNSQKFIDYCEFEYYARCREIAEDIAANIESKPIVLISGPSGSGKTTTAIILEHFLIDWGYKAHTISLDNYFCNLTPEDRAKSKEGKFDLEAPSRIDAEFLNDQLFDILQYTPVHMPRYNFHTAQREDSGWVYKREKNEVIIFEGTHALNPNVIRVKDEHVNTIYVSIRSCISFEDTTLISPEIRLARRMLRDVTGRGHSPKNTIDMSKKVNMGEDLYIKPFMHRSIHSIDTFIPYEINLYKTLLYGVLKEYEDNKTVQKLLTIMANAEPINPDAIPDTSLLREFIGGSVLKY